MDSSQFITSDNIVLVEVIKGVVTLSTIVLFTSVMQSSGDKRIADLLVSLKITIDASDKRTNDHISASDKRTNDHISASDKRFSDLLTSMKDVKVIEGELLKEKFNSTNDNIKKLAEDVEKIKEKYVKKDEEK
jgi:MoaA/NifB/PqqE/SkfB family radical SAM enzyme